MVIKLSESNGYGVSEMIYDILDGHYSSSSGDINEQYLQDDVCMWLKNEKRLAKEITNTRRKVTAVVWQAFIDLINYYGNEEYGSGYGWKMDQKVVQRWFKKYGADYKEVLAPVVAEVEQLRKERLGKKESVHMKESPVYGEKVVNVESPILQNFYTELQPLNRNKLCKVEMKEYVESIPGWGRKKTITTIYPEILIRLRTDSPVTYDFTNSITIREEDGSLVAYYTTDSQQSSEVHSFDDVDAIIREIFDYDQSWARESVKRNKRLSMKESSEFNPQDYYDLLYDQKRPSPDMIQAYRDYLGPDLANSYEAERIGENKLGYCDCYCCKCGQYLDKTNCPTGWYHYVSELSDDEGHAWRDFCDDCWEEVSDMSADEILDTFEPAPYGEDLGPNYKTESVKRTKRRSVREASERRVGGYGVVLVNKNKPIEKYFLCSDDVDNAKKIVKILKQDLRDKKTGIWKEQEPETLRAYAELIYQWLEDEYPNVWFDGFTLKDSEIDTDVVRPKKTKTKEYKIVNKELSIPIG